MENQIKLISGVTGTVENMAYKYAKVKVGDSIINIPKEDIKETKRGMIQTNGHYEDISQFYIGAEAVMQDNSKGIVTKVTDKYFTVKLENGEEKKIEKNNVKYFKTGKIRELSSGKEEKEEKIETQAEYIGKENEIKLESKVKMLDKKVGVVIAAGNKTITIQFKDGSKKRIRKEELKVLKNGNAIQIEKEETPVTTQTPVINSGKDKKEVIDNAIKMKKEFDKKMKENEKDFNKEMRQYAKENKITFKQLKQELGL